MAEYAGLEIRIGGNTTKLNNALKASTKSAAELQSRIRQATQAMQFDPNSLPDSLISGEYDLTIGYDGETPVVFENALTVVAPGQLPQNMLQYLHTHSRIWRYFS